MQYFPIRSVAAPPLPVEAFYEMIKQPSPFSVSVERYILHNTRIALQQCRTLHSTNTTGGGVGDIGDTTTSVGDGDTTTTTGDVGDGDTTTSVGDGDGDTTTTTTGDGSDDGNVEVQELGHNQTGHDYKV